MKKQDQQRDKAAPPVVEPDSRARAWRNAILAFVLAFGVLAFICGRLMQPDYLLAYFSTDGSLRQDYVDVDDLNRNDRWTSMTYTRYENGVAAARARFQRTLFSSFSITQHTSDGQVNKFVGETHDTSSNVYQVPRGMSLIDQIFYLKTDPYRYADLGRNRDLAGRNTYFSIYTRVDGANDLKTAFFLDYDEQSREFVLRQDRTNVLDDPDNPVYSFRTYPQYDDHAVTLAQDYDAQGNLVASTKAASSGSLRTVSFYDADGNLTGTQTEQLDWFGRLARRETFNANGTLLSREVYHYLFWERYGSLTGGFVLLATLCVSLWLGIEVYSMTGKRESKED